MLRNYEQGTVPEPKGSLGDIAISALFRAASRIHDRKMIATSLREAKRYEKRAAEHTDSGIERGRALLATGQAYLNARMPDKALTHLETAQPDIESYKSQGTFYGFQNLARLYQALGTAYQLTGRPEDSDNVQAKAESLADEIKEHFGICTDFYPDGSRLTYSAASQPGARDLLPADGAEVTTFLQPDL